MALITATIISLITSYFHLINHHTMINHQQDLVTNKLAEIFKRFAGPDGKTSENASNIASVTA